ncbi:hypothetical protein BB561_004106 [Smittium simulii]|uniref:RRM domain-containing protein n=1 Tax=Smittium simulii TaxID=133385 RepID=A0A2T9YI05_9FUNG|nr:hypothetical protein BB561_004106 [Smittium simulii]
MKFPTKDEFEQDPRVKFDLESEKYILCDPHQDVDYEYDSSSKAWFPRWNENLISEQQSVYDNPANITSNNIPEKKQACFSFFITTTDDKSTLKHKKRINTSVYVTGLPLDTDEEEVEQVFKKCGTIMPDILTGKPKIKLYRDDNNALKGDALITFFKEPSVNIAVDILDDSNFRYTESGKIKVQIAQFQPKTIDDKNIDDKNTKKQKLDPTIIKRTLAQLQKKLEWDEEGPAISEKYNKVVVLVGMFTQEELKSDITLLIDLKEDIREECERVGTVLSIKIYEDSLDGLVTVKFSDQLGAQAAVKYLIFLQFCSTLPTLFFTRLAVFTTNYYYIMSEKDVNVAQETTTDQENRNVPELQTKAAPTPKSTEIIMAKLLKFFASHGGCDNALMLIQYSSKILVWFLLKKKNSGLAKRIAALSALISDYRIMARVTDFFPLYISSLHTLFNPPKSLFLRAVTSIQSASMMAFYPFERLYWLGAHEILPMSKTTILKYALTASRAWAIWVLLNFFRLGYGYRELTARREACLYQPSVDANTLQKELDEIDAQMLTWKRNFLLNGRFFAKRQIHAYISTGKIKPSKTTENIADSFENNKTDAERLDKYAEWLENVPESNE